MTVDQVGQAACFETLCVSNQLRHSLDPQMQAFDDECVNDFAVVLSLVGHIEHESDVSA